MCRRHDPCLASCSPPINTQCCNVQENPSFDELCTGHSLEVFYKVESDNKIVNDAEAGTFSSVSHRACVRVWVRASARERVRE